MKDIRIKKSVAVSVILLFIGVAIAPSINFNVVKASNDNDLVEVTTQAYGIKGFGNTTVKLTRQQYQNLEQYLVDFRARLNQTTTREEAVPIFKEAVVELNKYGLLPKGMSVEQVQKLVIGPSQNLIVKNLIRKVPKVSNFSGIENHRCLVYGRFTAETYPLGIIGFSFFISYIIHIFNGFVRFLPFQLLGPVMFGVITVIPTHNRWEYYYDPAQGWITATGLNGLTQMSGLMYGTLGNIDFGMGGFQELYSKGMNSFTGLTIIFQGEKLLLGFTFHLGLTEYIPHR